MFPTLSRWFHTASVMLSSGRWGPDPALLSVCKSWCTESLETTSKLLLLFEIQIWRRERAQDFCTVLYLEPQVWSKKTQMKSAVDMLKIWPDVGPVNLLCRLAKAEGKIKTDVLVLCLFNYSPALGQSNRLLMRTISNESCGWFQFLVWVTESELIDHSGEDFALAECCDVQTVRLWGSNHSFGQFSY